MIKFPSKLADTTEPLRHLLKKYSSWLWGPSEVAAFTKVRELLSSTPILAHYSPERETIIAADASNQGLGAVLLKKQEDGTCRPVGFICHTQNAVEKNYATSERSHVSWRKVQ
ncbi:Pol polyprotein [Plakobranchus ocellatus]|uniref:Pol polyprotein n=1 Tax=Plakobranchus ocellatus TaxID=259542 RepID=A0AAV3ZQ44_9GAST|nr:Pol polyprotein [Plakobranchus ocellatus]